MGGCKFERLMRRNSIVGCKHNEGNCVWWYDSHHDCTEDSGSHEEEDCCSLMVI